MNFFNNKVIFITGGTGSFGRRFISTLLQKSKPKKVIVFSRDELKQFEMSNQLSKYDNLMRYFIGDVRDKDRLELATKGVDMIVHAAALKQVVASEYNPMETIKTNIYGAENVISAALNNNVDKIIALSTDKAVNPINLYGTTKLASDKLFIAANNIVGKNKCKFSIVRYGNVVNSRGSVIPLFKKYVDENHSYLPITDPSMTRFWITLDQGVNFVLNSFRLMIGGETFVPKIPSIKITDLAKAIGPNLKQKIVGIRPGEKIHELMCPNDSAHQTIEFKKYFVITPSIEMKHSMSSYLKNKQKELGKLVSKDFEYHSGTNENFLNISQIEKIIK